MYRSSSILFFALSIVLISCNSDDDGTPSEEQQANAGFFALEVGNKWTYNYFRVNSQSGELTNLDGVEEVEITEEEIVDGVTIYTVTTTTTDENNTCSVCNTNPMLITKVKDSLGYLVEIGSEIKFSSVSNVDYLVAEFEPFDVYRVLEENEVLITVPAGQFVCKSNQRYAIDNSDGSRFDGQDNVYYAEGIGEIRQTISAVTTERIVFEKQLMSYSVK